MRNRQLAERALGHAEQELEEIERTVWLAKAADHAVHGRAVLVGGAAVNLHTGSYRPTDVDMCAYLNETDRETLKELGFEHLQGDHFAYTFSDGQRWLLEFPSAQVDGDVTRIDLDGEEVLEVISLESLILDRVLQATDGTTVTFDEAVRLCFAVFEQAAWQQVEAKVSERNSLEPGLRIQGTYQRIMTAVRSMA